MAQYPPLTQEQCKSLFQHLHEHICSPVIALGPFEKPLLSLYLSYDEAMVRQLNNEALKLSEQIEKEGLDIPITIEQFLELMSQLTPFPANSPYSTGIVEVLEHVRSVATQKNLNDT